MVITHMVHDVTFHFHYFGVNKEKVHTVLMKQNHIVVHTYDMNVE